MRDLVKKILEHGVENVRFQIMARQRMGIFFPTYVMHDKEEAPCICTISEERYAVKENYKIHLVPQNPDFCSQDFYISDLESLMKGYGDEPSQYIFYEKYVDTKFVGESDNERYTRLNNENGPLHSFDDEPAVIGKTTGDKAWFKMNVPHRDNGPAVITKEGQIYMINGLAHREDGPAVIMADGREIYYHNGVEIEAPRTEQVEAPQP